MHSPKQILTRAKLSFLLTLIRWCAALTEWAYRQQGNAATWRSWDGTVTPIADLDDDHLQNVLAMLARQSPPDVRQHIRDAIEDECIRRFGLGSLDRIKSERNRKYRKPAARSFLTFGDPDGQ